MDLDDRQELTHVAKHLSEHLAIMHNALREALPNDQGLADDLLKTWWQLLLTQAATPDFGSIINGMFQKDDD